MCKGSVGVAVEIISINTQMVWLDQQNAQQEPEWLRTGSLFNVRVGGGGDGGDEEGGEKMEHLTSAIKHTEMVLPRMGKCRHLPQRGGGGGAGVGGGGH